MMQSSPSTSLTEAVVARAGGWAGELVMPAFQTNWPRWRQVTDLAASRGVLCFGPNRGRNITYTNPGRWLPEFRPVDGKTALRWLLRSYLHAYGPATPRDFGQWLALSPRWATELFSDCAADLEQVELDGEPAWVVNGDTTTPEEFAARCAAPALLRCVCCWEPPSRSALSGAGGPAGIGREPGRQFPGPAY